MTCECSACKARRAAKPREQWGSANGEWRQPSTYFAEFSEARWDMRMKRDAERKMRDSAPQVFNEPGDLDGSGMRLRPGT